MLGFGDRPWVPCFVLLLLWQYCECDRSLTPDSLPCQVVGGLTGVLPLLIARQVLYAEEPVADQPDAAAAASHLFSQVEPLPSHQPGDDGWGIAGGRGAAQHHSVAYITHY